MADTRTNLLWPEGEAKQIPKPARAIFTDLHIQEIIDAVCAAVTDYALADWYQAFPGNAAVIRHRHAVLRDLLDPMQHEAWSSFAQDMRGLRRQVDLARQLYHQRQRQRVFLGIICTYHQALCSLTNSFALSSPQSPALRAVCEAVRSEWKAPQRQELHATAATLRDELDTLGYDLQISGSHLSLWRQRQERNVDAEIANCFSRFLAAEPSAEQARDEEVSGQMDLDPVEARVLDAVAELYPETFARLASFTERWVQPGEKTAQATVPALDIGRYPFVFAPLLHWEREIHFYLAYLDYLAPLQANGLPNCIPELCDAEKRTLAADAYDLALAQSLRQEQGQALVLNDIELRGNERILLVSGPNQGGKTTYARCFGQLHYLAGIGLPVPARHAEIFVCDAIYTQFERHEDANTGRSKLEADLRRLHKNLQHATPRSIFILNELFHSTTLADARFLSQELLERLRHLDVLVLWVSFLEELSRAGADIISILSTVAKEDQERRSFRLLREPADGLAHALSLAKKYGLDYQKLVERIRHASPSS
ncbi:hypothetical protein AB4090_09030 [Acidithiobacillus sp. IBUN Pt1247-S3]|uniref:MutS-related protein n=1 Tax=Acidithiobacillus sp. IBUN Pt1247-S3 TaxID=3166642 RepID=UPI0034E3D828